MVTPSTLLSLIEGRPAYWQIRTSPSHDGSTSTQSKGLENRKKTWFQLWHDPSARCLCAVHKLPSYMQQSWGLRYNKGKINLYWWMNLSRKHPLPLSLLYYMNCVPVIYIVWVSLYIHQSNILQSAINKLMSGLTTESYYPMICNIIEKLFTSTL